MPLSWNEIISFARAADGSLQQGRGFATGGRGTRGCDRPPGVARVSDPQSKPRFRLMEVARNFRVSRARLWSLSERQGPFWRRRTKRRGSARESGLCSQCRRQQQRSWIQIGYRQRADGVLNTSFFGGKPSIFDVLKARATKDGYGDLVAIGDSPAEVIEFMWHTRCVRSPRSKSGPRLDSPTHYTLIY
jgi:hypothetical protein